MKTTRKEVEDTKGDPLAWSNPNSGAARSVLDTPEQANLELMVVRLEGNLMPVRVDKASR